MSYTLPQPKSQVAKQRMRDICTAFTAQHRSSLPNDWRRLDPCGMTLLTLFIMLHLSMRKTNASVLWYPSWFERLLPVAGELSSGRRYKNVSKQVSESNLKASLTNSFNEHNQRQRTLLAINPKSNISTLFFFHYLLERKVWLLCRYDLLRASVKIYSTEYLRSDEVKGLLVTIQHASSTEELSSVNILHSSEQVKNDVSGLWCAALLLRIISRGVQDADVDIISFPEGVKNFVQEAATEIPLSILSMADYLDASSQLGQSIQSQLGSPATSLLELASPTASTSPSSSSSSSSSYFATPHSSSSVSSTRSTLSPFHSTPTTTTVPSPSPSSTLSSSLSPGSPPSSAYLDDPSPATTKKRTAPKTVRNGRRKRKTRQSAEDDEEGGWEEVEIEPEDPLWTYLLPGMTGIVCSEVGAHLGDVLRLGAASLDWMCLFSAISHSSSCPGIPVEQMKVVDHPALRLIRKQWSDLVEDVDETRYQKLFPRYRTNHGNRAAEDDLYNIYTREEVLNAIRGTEKVIGSSSSSSSSASKELQQRMMRGIDLSAVYVLADVLKLNIFVVTVHYTRKYRLEDHDLDSVPQDNQSKTRSRGSTSAFYRLPPPSPTNGSECSAGESYSVTCRLAGPRLHPDRDVIALYQILKQHCYFHQKYDAKLQRRAWIHSSRHEHLGLPSGHYESIVQLSNNNILKGRWSVNDPIVAQLQRWSEESNSEVVSATIVHGNDEPDTTTIRQQSSEVAPSAVVEEEMMVMDEVEEKKEPVRDSVVFCGVVKWSSELFSDNPQHQCWNSSVPIPSGFTLPPVFSPSVDHAPLRGWLVSLMRTGDETRHWLTLVHDRRTHQWRLGDPLLVNHHGVNNPMIERLCANVSQSKRVKLSVHALPLPTSTFSGSLLLSYDDPESTVETHGLFTLQASLDYLLSTYNFHE